ncbi:MAG: hypothetical protein WCV82_01300 [Candidatus Paceibacterota bacterium]
MNENPTLRVLLDIFLLILTLFGYWYVALPIALLSAWSFPFYVELVIMGFVYDALFGMGRGLGVWGYLALFITVVLFAAISFLKVIIRK